MYTGVCIALRVYVQLYECMNVHEPRCPHRPSSPGAAQQSTRPAVCLDSRGGRAGGARADLGGGERAERAGDERARAGGEEDYGLRAHHEQPGAERPEQIGAAGLRTARDRDPPRGAKAPKPVGEVKERQEELRILEVAVLIHRSSSDRPVGRKPQHLNAFRRNNGVEQ